jgi:hypothetical protein
MNPADVPIMDLEVFAGISFPMSFSLENVDVDGNVTGPYDLTGWTVAVVFRKAIHNGTLTLLSGTAANAAGSICEVTDVPNGKFRFNLTATELANPNQADGDWRIEIRQGDEAQILTKGHFRFVPFTTGGEL